MSQRINHLAIIRLTTYLSSSIRGRWYGLDCQLGDVLRLVEHAAEVGQDGAAHHQRPARRGDGGVWGL